MSTTYGWKNEETLRAAIWYRDCQPPQEAAKRLGAQKLAEILKLTHIEAIGNLKEKGLYVILIEICLSRIDWLQIAEFIINNDTT